MQTMPLLCARVLPAGTIIDMLCQQPNHYVCGYCNGLIHLSLRPRASEPRSVVQQGIGWLEG